MRLIIITGINLIFCLSCFADEDYTLEKIVVTGGPAANENRNYPCQTLRSQDIAGKHADSLPDILKCVPGVDLRYRGVSGLQGDLSIRGATYEQSAILIDGIRINDPQTGHYNLDIPLTSLDIERIEVMKQGSSSMYGAGALAGGINIVTKKPLKKSVIIKTLAGEHALYGQAFSCAMPEKDHFSNFSFEHKTSNGARPNTDFDYQTYSYMFNKDWQDNSFDLLAGYQDKDYGADSFYSNLFNEEEEHTKTLFIKTGVDSDMCSYGLKNSVFLRRHHDKFILKRNEPEFSRNTHTSYSYGFHSGINLPMTYGEIQSGFEIARDTINSTNLGKNTRMNEACFAGFAPYPGNKFEPSARFRLDHFQNWSYQNSFDAGLGYWLIDNKLKIKSSFGHAFRGPSFTELYYSDPANKGNPNLEVEKSDSYSAGFEAAVRDNIKIECDAFTRRVKNLIDYTRPTTNDVWQASNIGRVDFKGVELRACVKETSFSYTYMEADKDNEGFLSKYGLDILKHQLTLELGHEVRGVNIGWQFSYNERKFGETYFIGNIHISRALKNNKTTIEPFIKIDNFTDTDYSEVAGVIQPGRWIQGGVTVKW
ncbi:MAG: TonB-dependent receptor [Candidatus Omnitrophota bacterium]